jgi:2-enoate reductase
MENLKYPELFKPFDIGSCHVKNRVVMTAMDTKHETENYIWSDETIGYYIERAKGGVGLIHTYACYCDSHVENGPAVDSPFADPARCREQLTKLADGVHKYGCKLFVQLWSGFGRIAFPMAMEGDLVSASDCANLWDPESRCRALTKDEIHRIVKAHIEAAKLCQECGADGVNIVAAYGGYLGDQMCMELFNRRTDEYGGSLENRARMDTEIISGIKAACGADFPVTCRFSIRNHMKSIGHGHMPEEPYTEVGRDTAESIALAKLFVAAGADGFLIGEGSYDAMYWQYPPMYQKEGLWLDDVKPFAREIHVPIMCPGRILMPDMANAAIADGTLTAAALGRALLADPQWPEKAREGRDEDIRPCIGCNNGCMARVMSGLPIMCAVNAELFNERNQAYVPAEVKKKIAVVGAGIGGMETARVAKLRGHDVTVFEKSDRVGGLFVAASVPDFKQGDRRLISWYEKQMRDLGIEVRLNTEATAETLKAGGYDAVVAATGTQPRIPNMPGIEKVNAVSAVDVLYGKADYGKKLVIIGGGWIGCETALWLSENRDVDISVVEMSQGIMTGGEIQPAPSNEQYMVEALDYRPNVHVYTRAKVVSFDTRLVRINQKKAGEIDLPADTVIISIGLRSQRALYDELKESFGENAYLVGDAEAPGNILIAVQKANEVAKSI